MIIQKEFTLTPHRRGFHLITEEIVRNLPQLPPTGLLHLFIKHTSAALTINENADTYVQTLKLSSTTLSRSVSLTTNIPARVTTICRRMPNLPL